EPRALLLLGLAGEVWPTSGLCRAGLGELARHQRGEFATLLPRRRAVMNRSTPQRAFTLIELLVVIAIIGILASLLRPCLAKAKSRARRVEETSAARQLVLGVQLYADENEDTMFPGYVSDPAAMDDRGQTLSFPVNARYPWRMVPYLSGSMALIYSGENRA